MFKWYKSIQFFSALVLILLEVVWTSAPMANVICHQTEHKKSPSNRFLWHFRIVKEKPEQTVLKLMSWRLRLCLKMWKNKNRTESQTKNIEHFACSSFITTSSIRQFLHQNHPPNTGRSALQPVLYLLHLADGDIDADIWNYVWVICLL